MTSMAYSFVCDSCCYQICRIMKDLISNLFLILFV